MSQGHKKKTGRRSVTRSGGGKNDDRWFRWLNLVITWRLEVVEAFSRD